MKSAHAAATKVPPYSVHSEKVLLGSMLRQPGIIKDIRRIIAGGEAFFRPEHGRFFDALIEATGKRRSLDTEALIAAVTARGLLNEPGGAERLCELTNAAQDPAAAMAHAKVVAEKARMRRLIDAVSDILHDAYHSADGVEAVLSRARQRLDELATTAR